MGDRNPENQPKIRYITSQQIRPKPELIRKAILLKNGFKIIPPININITINFRSKL